MPRDNFVIEVRCFLFLGFRGKYRIHMSTLPVVVDYLMLLFLLYV